MPTLSPRTGGSSAPPSDNRLGASYLDRVAVRLRSLIGGDLQRGHAAVLLLALAYTIVMLLLARQGAHPVPAPFLRIPDEHYYLWATAFTAPVLLAGWVLASGVAQLLAWRAGGQGSFEQLASTFGIAIGLASLTTLIPDLVMGALGEYGGSWSTTPVGRSLIITWLVAYVALFSLLFPAAVRLTHALPPGRCVRIGLGAFAVYQGFLFAFIR